MGSDSSVGSTATGGLSTTEAPARSCRSTISPAEPRRRHRPSGDPHADFDGSDDSEDPSPAPVTDYSYTADIQFGLVDDLERYANVQRLGLVPSRELPLIMYLGVSADNETAVFMVDSRLSQGGEGSACRRTRSAPSSSSRRPATQDEHHFRDADGNEYLLRLLGLNADDRVVRQPQRPRRLGAQRQPAGRRRHR